MKNICVVGTGYIGLVGAAIFADWGNNVIGVDIDERKIKKIESGVMPIYEPGLSEVVLSNIENKRLKFTTSLKEGVKDADVIFICVGTPQGFDGHANLSYVYGVAKDIAHLLDADKYRVVVTKSTVPVGTNEKVKNVLVENAPDGVKVGTHFDVASNPEFLREGSSVEDMRDTDRTIIGADSDAALNLVSEIYEHLDSPIVKTDLRSAELTKYASNSFLATKISFINEIAQICERLGADVSDVAKGMGLDNRIGPKMLYASTGYGGSCFPKDVAAMYAFAMDSAYHFKILESVMQVNDFQQVHFANTIARYYGPSLEGKTFACLGLAFKYKTDDVRESTAIKIIRMLRGMGANIRAFDPAASTNAQKELGNGTVYYANSVEDALDGADALCILTEWVEFGEIEPQQLTALKDKAVFDGRNMFDKKVMEDAGFDYFAIGKRTKALAKLDEHKR